MSFMRFIEKFSDFIGKNIAFVVVIGAAIALFKPSSVEFIKTTYVGPMLGIIIFGMGLTVSLKDFEMLIKNPKDVIVGIFAQFLIMPLLAFILIKSFNLSTELAIGVALVGCAPGGTSSNVITFLAKGDVALSVSMTSCTTLLSPVVTPFLVNLLIGTSVSVDTFSMFIDIVKVIIVPISLGILAHRFFPGVTSYFRGVLPLVSTIVIVAIVMAIVGRNASAILDASYLLIVLVSLHNLFGYAFGYFTGVFFKQNLAKKKALAIEVGMQNSGLAAALAINNFATYPLAAVPAVIFSIWHNISGGILASLFSRFK